MRHRGADGRLSEFATLGLRFAAEETRPFDCRLFLRSRERSIEIGQCIAAEERRAMAPLIALSLFVRGADAALGLGLIELNDALAAREVAFSPPCQEYRP